MTSSHVITGIGHSVPKQVITNQFFDTLNIGSSADWVEEKTGIKTRHTVLNPDVIRQLAKGETTYQHLKEAGEIPSIGELAKKPWQMAKEEDPECVPLLRALVTASFISILYLRPFLPAKYEAMNEKFGFHVEKTFPVSLDELSIKDEELESWPMLFKRMELVAPKA